jgi:dolichol-phosphate mannosyltransferase
MIWVILPAFNEAASLPRLLPGLDATLRGLDAAYRIVAVDDGSTDGTAGILAEHATRLPLDVLTHPLNRGLGETERDGFELVSARCSPDDVIVRVEGDDTHEPAYIADLLRRLEEGCDVAITSRFRPGGGQVGVGAYRAAVSRAANVFMRLVFAVPGVRDYSCGFRAYRARVIQDAIRVYGNNFVQLKGLGFTSTLEILVKLHLLGCRFGEVPFTLRYDKKGGGSKMVTSLTTLGYLIMALVYHWPFSGWRRLYRGLKTLYREDAGRAVERFGPPALRRRGVSRVSL